jgi:hypothetical protein
VLNTSVNFTDGENHNKLFSGVGKDEADLIANGFTFEIKPEKSISSLHNANFAIRYRVRSDTVIFKIVPNKVEAVD